MDGKNRTIIINVNRNSTYYYDAILSLTLDYQAQMIYWVFGNYSNHSLTIKRSNIDGTNQQTISQPIQIYGYYYAFDYPPGLTMYQETLFMSLPWMREIYKIGINGENFTTFINSSAQVFCSGYYYQLKVTKQPSG